jgi:hypothetical protein
MRLLPFAAAVADAQKRRAGRCLRPNAGHAASVEPGIEPCNGSVFLDRPAKDSAETTTGSSKTDGLVLVADA